MRIRNVLIVNTFGIGDVLFSTPLVRGIKENFPETGVHYICNRRNTTLLRNDPEIESVIVYEKDDFRLALKESKIKGIKKIARFIKKIKDLNIDVAIDLTLNYQMRIVLMLAGVKNRVGFNYRGRGRFLTRSLPLRGFEGRHVAAHYLDLLGFLDISPIAGRYGLRAYSSGEGRDSVDRLLKEKGLAGKRLVGIVAGGGKSWGEYASYRRWPRENFAYLARKLAEGGDLAIVIFGTKEENHICEEIQKDVGPKAVSMCGKTNLDTLIEFIGRLDLLICNEGGPLHIAVSRDINTISIYGPVDDAIYGPYPVSPKHKIVKAENVECRPCYKNFKHRMCETRDCLNKIDRDYVLKLAKESLGI